MSIEAMKSWLIDAGETLLGTLWWGSVWTWSSLLSAMLILAPLLLANIAAELRASIPPTIALAGGVVAAYAINLPPWDADEPESLPLVVGGAAISAVVWDLLRGSADVVTLLVVVGLAAVGWPIRRLISSRGPRAEIA